MKKLTALSVCFALVFCVSFISSATASDEKDVLQVAANFNNSMQNNDGELMASLWDSTKSSAFGPIKSVAFLFDGKTLETHWKSMSSMPEGAASGTTLNEQVVMLGNNVAIYTAYGILTFNPPIAKEASTTIQIRRSLVLQKSGGKWLIVHGHDSELPTE